MRSNNLFSEVITYCLAAVVPPKISLDRIREEINQAINDELELIIGSAENADEANKESAALRFLALQKIMLCWPASSNDTPKEEDLAKNEREKRRNEAIWITFSPIAKRWLPHGSNALDRDYLSREDQGLVKRIIEALKKKAGEALSIPNNDLIYDSLWGCQPSADMLVSQTRDLRENAEWLRCQFERAH